MKNIIKVSLISLVFFLTSGVCFANDFSYQTDYGQNLDAFAYDDNDKLYFEYSLDADATKSYIYLIKETSNAWNNFVSTVNVDHASNHSQLNIGQKYCSGACTYTNLSCPDISAQTYTRSGITYYYIGKGQSTGKCYPNYLYYTYKNGTYGLGNVYNATGLTKTDIDNYFGSDFLENYAIIPTSYSGSNSISTHNYFSNSYTSDVSASDMASGIISSTTTYFPITGASNGTCGSSDGGSFIDTPTTNLCATGTATEVNDNGTEYRWSCMGSGGGTYENCSAFVSLGQAQCGSSNGIISTTQPTGTNACYSGLITDMTQHVDDSWGWTCEVSGSDFVYCNTVASAPIIPPDLPSNDSIFCSITPTDLSTIADCMGSVLRWAFLPHQSTLDEFYALPSSLSSKVPFGYFYSVADLFRGLSYTAPSNWVISMTLQNDQVIELLDVNEFMANVGTTAKDMYFNGMRALLWLLFVIWAYNQGRNIFNNKDD